MHDVSGDYTKVRRLKPDVAPASSRPGRPPIPGGMTAVFDALLVLAGATCMAAGFFFGSWHQRGMGRDRFAADGEASNERVMKLMRSIMHDSEDATDDERPN
jgi:hypothetical protein